MELHDPFNISFVKYGELVSIKVIQENVPLQIHLPIQN